MNTTLSHISAARFWDAFGSTDVPARSLSISSALRPPSASSLELVGNLGIFPNNEDIHVLVSKQADRRSFRNLSCHSCDRAFPNGSFFEITPGVAVCSPELTYVQMANRLNMPQLSLFAMMLCGIYARDVNATEEVCQSGPVPRVQRRRRLYLRRPVASPQSLRMFAQEIASFPGSRRGLAALEFVLPCSLSPMESIAALCLTLPPRYGGYSFPHPFLNYPVYVDEAITPDVRKFNGSQPMGGALGRGSGKRVRYDEDGRPYYECDMVWPDKRLVVEYHGGPYHTGQESVHRDSLKANILSACGYTELVLTKETVFDGAKFADFTVQLANRLGRRIRKMPDGFEAKRVELVRSLTVGYRLS